MTSDKPAGGPLLLERDTEVPQATPKETTPRGGRRGLYWPLVGLIVAALIGTWALTQWQTGDEVIDATPRAVSDHDSLIAMQLRDRQAVRPQHDSLIALQLRDRQAVRPQHDSLIALQLRDRQGNPEVPPQHDSGIAAQLKAHSGGAGGCHHVSRTVVDPSVAKAC